MSHIPTIDSELRDGNLIEITTVETPRVDRMMNVFDTQWRTTADVCVLRAQELEAAALDLRQRAERLMAARDLCDEVKGAVQFEIKSRQRADALALVNPTDEN
jgi:hypothetical protein